MKLLLILLLLTACTITGEVVKEYTQPTEVYFCPRDDCKNIFVSYLESANEINCALYDLNIVEAAEILKNKNARVIMEDKNAFKTELNPVIDSKYSVMHNKFCILDDKIVITGSMNPTLRGTTKNNNNLLVFHSKTLASIYNNEFEELHTEDDGKDDNVLYINNDKVEVYFCPEDWCANKILYALDDAKESIHFMIFSFTHEKIADILIKKANQGLIVKGVTEKSQSGKRSVFQKLNHSTVDVRKDENKANMHHKVFIIDDNIVITGSMNPTISGDTRNDENLLIINSKDMAKKYLEEFNLIP